MTAQYLSSTSGWIHNMDASGNMVVDFYANPNKFPLLKYTQIVPVKKPAGKYMRITREEAGRLLDANINDYLWADGNVAPEGTIEEKQEYLNFTCERRTYPWIVGNILAENADTDVPRQRERIAGEKAMRARTQLVYNALTTSGNWDATHILDVTDNTDIEGVLGAWDESTTSRKDIYRSLTYGMELILQDTLNGIDVEKDLHLVISSEAARRLGMCQEIVDMVKASPEALAQIRGELPGGYVRYGLPAKLYGVDLVVDDTYKVTSARGASSTARSQIWSRLYAFLLARPGALVATEGSAPFSTISWFAYKQLENWRKDDKDNERQQGRVQDFGSAEMPAPVSGIWFQNITA